MRWFISDTHFFHRNIGKFTDNSNIDDRHNVIIKNWNNRIKSKDIVYIIGDFSFGNYDKTLEIVKQLNGEKILIRGNHDYRFTSKDFIDMGFKDVRDYLMIKLSNREEILLSHYPYRSSWYKQLYYKYIKKSINRKYYEHYPKDCGRWLIHGHHHSGPRVKGKSINVNVDVNNFKPISETDLYKIINKEIYEKNIIRSFNRLCSAFLGNRTR